MSLAWETVKKFDQVKVWFDLVKYYFHTVKIMLVSVQTH